MVAVVAVGSDYDVVKHSELHIVASFFQFFSDVIVRDTGAEVAGWVVMSEYYTLGIFKEGIFYSSLYIKQRGCTGAFGETYTLYDFVHAVH